MPIKRYKLDLEYKKNKNIRKDVVLQILDWVHGQPHLPKVKEEDVIAYLTACLYSSEVTKQTLDLNYTYRTHIPELFANRDPANTQTDLLHKSLSNFLPLPGLTEDGYKVFYCQLKSMEDYSAFNTTAEMRSMVYTHDQVLYEEGAQKGVMLLLDMCHARISIMTKLSPTILMKTANFALNAAAISLIKIHMIHPPSFVDKFIIFVKSVLSKDITDRIIVHSNLEDLYKLFPTTMLPSNVGGDLEDLDILYERYNKRIIENRDYFIEEAKLRVDESLRPGKPTSVDTFLGVTGSFRKLDID